MRIISTLYHFTTTKYKQITNQHYIILSSCQHNIYFMKIQVCFKQLVQINAHNYYKLMI